MTVSEIVAKMIDSSEGNTHDIAHFLKVYAYAKTIGECEGLDADVQTTLEVSAILHDIACPLCRKKYGNTDGPNQEREGAVLAADFLREAGAPQDLTERVSYLVGHHHTLDQINGLDYQILIEADYLVNADESGYAPENIRNMYDMVFKTETGRALLRSVYPQAF